jgi:hypothetical protein
MWKEAHLVRFQRVVEGTEEKQSHSQNSQYPGLDSNQRFPEHKALINYL